MRTVIFTEGGRNIGLGHIARCIAVYEELDARGLAPVFVVPVDSAAKKALRGFRAVFSDWKKGPVPLLEGIERPVCALVDSYLAGAETYRRLSLATDLLACLDDTRRLRYPSGAMVINGNIFARKLYRSRSLKFLLGPGYMLLRRPFYAVPARRTRAKMGRILIASGGDDGKNLSPFLLRTVLHNFPGIEVRVAVGSGFRNVGYLRSASGPRAELVMHPDAAGMKKLMLWADAAVSACGQTLYEMARTGLPAVGVVVAPNQGGNAAGLAGAGALVYAGRWRKDPEPRVSADIVKALKRLASPAVRAEMSAAGISLVDGRGAIRIAGEICSRLGETGRQQ